MDYFGWTLGKNLFLGAPKHLSAHGIPFDDPEDFIPDESLWTQLLANNASILEKAHLTQYFKRCFHITEGAAEMIINLGLLASYLEAVRSLKPHEFELGMHAIHEDKTILGERGFSSAFKKSISIGKQLQITAMVEHTPIGAEDKTDLAVEILSSPEICELIDISPFPICWENKADYRWKSRFYGSLKAVVDFRNALKDSLHEKGYGHLMKKHLITFDTGHLLVWRNHHDDPTIIAQRDEEIAEYLPQLSPFIKVFHIQVNDGIKDHHVTPFSPKYLDLPSREGLTSQILEENSQRVLDWLKICNSNNPRSDRHVHIEAGTLPFDLDQYVDFARHLQEII